MKASSFLAAIPFLAIALHVPAKAAPKIFDAIYEENVFRACPPQTQAPCQPVFSAAPKKILITRAACLIQTASTLTSVIIGVQTATSGLIVHRYEYLPLPTAVVSNGNWYSALWSADLLVGGGQKPAIGVDAAPGTNPVALDCKITGRVQQ